MFTQFPSPFWFEPANTGTSCVECRGNGYVWAVNRADPGDCPACDGTGRLAPPAGRSWIGRGVVYAGAALSLLALLIA